MAHGKNVLIKGYCVFEEGRSAEDSDLPRTWASITIDQWLDLFVGCSSASHCSSARRTNLSEETGKLLKGSVRRPSNRMCVGLRILLNTRAAWSWVGSADVGDLA